MRVSKSRVGTVVTIPTRSVSILDCAISKEPPPDALTPTLAEMRDL
jgi:hypothetical protein